MSSCLARSPSAGFVRAPAALLFVWMLCLTALTARADDAPRKTYNLPPGDAAVTLKQFVEQSGEDVVYLETNVRGVETNAVKGEMTAIEALERMLVGTALHAVQDERTGALTVNRRNAVAGPAPNSVDDARKDQVVNLSPFEVKSAPMGYEATSSASGTRLDTPLADLSKNILVLTRDLIEDQGTNDLNSAVAYAASVAPSGPDQGQGLSVRGFGGNSPKRNGLGIYGTDESVYDTATMDRIEVVKGPAALLYGVSSPGGLVNYITKQPLSVEQTSIRFLAGSWDNYRMEFDTGGPLIGDGHTLNHRLIVAGSQGNSFANFGKETRGVISDDVRWFIGDHTYITFGGEYNMRNSNAIRTLDNAGIVWRATFNPDGTLKTPYASIDYNARDYLGITPYTTEDTVVKRVDLDVAHQFTDTLNFFIHYNYVSNNLQNMGEFFQLAEGVGGVGPDHAQEVLYYRLPHRSTQNVTASFSDTFENSWAKVEVVAGVELFHYFLSFESDGPKVYPTVDFVTGAGYNDPQPNTETQVDAAIVAGTWVNQFKYFEHQDYASPYLITHTHLFNDRLRIILGVRHDSIRDGQDFYGNAGDPANPFKLLPVSSASYYTSATSPLVGVSFNPIEGNKALSLYYSYSESLQPNEVVDQATGHGLGPQTGKGNEVGLKVDLTNKLFAQLGFYSIEKTGIPETVPGSFPTHTILGGLQRARGTDLDLTWTTQPGWQTMLGLAYVDAKYVSDPDPLNIGQQLPGIPTFRATLWTKYVIQTGSLRGFSLGGGIIHQTSTNNGYGYPGLTTAPWTRVDFLFGYTMKVGKRERIDYTLGITNAFDEKYAFNPSTLGFPRKIQATMKYSF
jgi:iron complex outermembrane receptor protein